MANYNDSWLRLEQVISWAKMSTNQFAHHIGLLRPDNIYHIKAGRVGISKNLVQHIVGRYPEISSGWLLTGEGSMLRDEKQLIAFCEGGISDLRNFDDRRASALSCQYFNLPFLNGCDCAYRNYDEAMSDEIMPEMIVFLKKTDISAIIQGDMYVIVSSNFVLLRSVRVGDDGRELLLSPKHRSYDDVSVNVEQVLAVYRVAGALKLL